MKRISILSFLLVVCFATAMKAQAPAPKPDPEMKKLHVLVGHWTYEGESKPGPLGPGGKSSGEFGGQMTLGGFFWQGRWTEKGASGSLVIWGYDAVNKNFTAEAYWGDGTRLSAVVTVSANTFTWSGKVVAAGKPYPARGRIVVAADSMSFTETAEISPEGKMWTPFAEYKYTKVQPAAKK